MTERMTPAQWALLAEIAEASRRTSRAYRPALKLVALSFAEEDETRRRPATSVSCAGRRLIEQRR